MPPPFRAYEGEEPYIFVSYSHKDADKVYPELTSLNEQGFNIWYDEGINPGESWRNEIANAISGCDLFILLVTPNSAVSEHCMREVNFAQNKGRPLLAIHLEATTLSDELEFNLSDRQALMKYSLSASDYQRKLRERLRSVLHATATKQLETEIATEKPSRLPYVAVVAVIGIISIVGLFFFFDATPVTEQEVGDLPAVVATAAPKNSIAVLPFENLSPSDDNAYFAAGVHEDVIQSLAKIGELTVIARKSVQRYADSELSVMEIGEELNVANILQGSVRRAGDKVRVTVSLVDTTSRATLWGETYDRTLTDIFAIQSDIAREIASQLQISMDLEMSSSIARAPTDNFTAYELFLEARSINEPKDKIRLLNDAIELDPGFADAHAELALATMGGFSFFFGSQSIDYDAAEEHADIAYKLAPASTSALRAKARFYARTRNTELANKFFKEAVESAPSDASLIFEQANHQLISGDLTGAYELLRRSLVLDPNSPETSIAMADLLIDELRIDEIDPYLQKALRLSNGDFAIRRSVALAYSRAGDDIKGLQLISSILSESPDSIIDMVWISTTLAAHDEIDAAEKWVARLRQISPQVAEVAYGVILNVTERSDLEYELAKNAVAAFPDDRDYLVRMAYGASGQARAFVREERNEEALAKWQESATLLKRAMAPDMRDGQIEIRLDNTLSFVVYALILDLAGERKEAVEIANRHLDWSDAQPSARRVNGHFLDAIAKSVLRDHEGALDSFLKIENESTGFDFVYWFDVFGVNQGFGDVYGNLPNNIAYKDLVHRLKERQKRRAIRLMEQFPRLHDASIGIEQI